MNPGHFERTSMFAARNIALNAIRRSIPTTIGTPAKSYLQPYSHSITYYPTFRNENNLSLSAVIPSEEGGALTWWQGVWTNLQDGLYQMSSTLKKRRSKMNKHKLRKRRKKNRMKTRKQ